MAFQIYSDSFKHGAMIPAEYTCDGADISPHLAWEGAPASTKSFVLIMDDPDAPMGIWDHWILFNIPTDTRELEENVQILPPGTDEAKNSWGRMGYGGPCPPEQTHHYFISLFALDTELTLHPGIRRNILESAMHGHVLEKAELMGKYKRVSGSR